MSIRDRIALALVEFAGFIASDRLLLSLSWYDYFRASTSASHDKTKE